MRSCLLVGVVDELAAVHAEDDSEWDSIEDPSVGLENFVFLSALLANLDATKPSSDAGITGVVRSAYD